ncbi:hypothetical protein IEQ34_003308 [Dendrobium chrysotoxum]|uniref:Uncharacterized protein n=1 Tax=Dendrobium chrysotoxum TaxID=161865 RepID=A0AAV7HLS3_DENCH|nr:hypothetical protein IEQ34_003308 [Dendrobium chrysotoxum]
MAPNTSPKQFGFHALGIDESLLPDSLLIVMRNKRPTHTRITGGTSKIYLNKTKRIFLFVTRENIISPIQPNIPSYPKENDVKLSQFILSSRFLKEGEKNI